MSTVEDYVARIEETCGAEKSAVVTFKYNKKDEAIAKIMKKAELKNSLSGIIFDLSFQGTSFRMFSSGKLVFKNIKSKEAVHDTLAALLL
jgi:TATA-box binding protein (TBP) (component of TFIID and TFIIIB)